MAAQVARRRRYSPPPEDPAERQVPLARWLPLALPVLLHLLQRFTPLRSPSASYVAVSLALVFSGRVFRRTGRGLGFLSGFQFGAGLVATVFFAANLIEAETWRTHSGVPALMSAYASYLCNLIGSYLPR